MCGVCVCLLLRYRLGFVPALVERDGFSINESRASLPFLAWRECGRVALGWRTERLSLAYRVGSAIRFLFFFYPPFLLFSLCYPLDFCPCCTTYPAEAELKPVNIVALFFFFLLLLPFAGACFCFNLLFLNSVSERL